MVDISYNDLMIECGFTNSSEFHRILLCRGFNISPKDKISKRTANEIVRKFTGRPITNWYSRKRQIEETPIKRKNDASVYNDLERWYLSITEREQLSNGDYILGLVCTGGFLCSEDGKSEFIFPLSADINILIGNRGSGKSTVLNLLGLGSNTISEETSSLEKMVLHLLKPQITDEINLNRTIRSTLHYYGVKQYAMFFQSSGFSYCYFIDRDSLTYNLLKRVNNQWTDASTNTAPSLPSMILVKQGEVMRIAEESNKFIINFLDATYPDLLEQRQILTRQATKFLQQWDGFKEERINFNAVHINRFIRNQNRRNERINQIKQKWDNMLVLQEGNIHLSAYDVNELINAIESLKEDIDQYKVVETKYSSESVFDILKSGDDESSDSFIYLYLAGMDIDRLESALSTLGSISNFYTDAIRSALGGIANILNRELSKVSSWVRLFSENRVDREQHFVFTDSLRSLIKHYDELIRGRILLLKTQEEKSGMITSRIRDNLDVKIYTVNVQSLSSDHLQELSDFNQIEGWYMKLIKASPVDDDLDALFEVAYKYDSTVQDLLRKLELVYEDIVSDQNPFIFPSIQMELRQGTEYRAFRQLSFGQRSGIILKLLLEAANRSTVIIDQPEDNLDADSILTIIAPTIKRLGKEKQIVLATHNPNLAMRYTDGTLSVHESAGDYGYLKARGRFADRQILREALNVLEGGVSQFIEKIDAYEELTNMVLPWSSHRVRTIEKLKTRLAQIQGEPSLVDALFHELNNKRYDEVQELLDDLKRGENKKTIPESVELHSFFAMLRARYIEVDKEIVIDPKLERVSALADRGDLKLAFVNLMENSFQAAERRISALMLSNPTVSDKEIVSRIEIDLDDIIDNNIILKFRDNGCEIPEDIFRKLYKERCTTQESDSNGDGGMLIKQCLERNGGAIKIEKTTDSGTTQTIILKSFYL